MIWIVLVASAILLGIFYPSVLAAAVVVVCTVILLALIAIAGLILTADILDRETP
jgi:hypothetical protein